MLGAGFNATISVGPVLFFYFVFCNLEITGLNHDLNVCKHQQVLTYPGRVLIYISFHNPYSSVTRPGHGRGWEVKGRYTGHGKIGTVIDLYRSRYSSVV
jgi:hypothetical protein